MINSSRLSQTRRIRYPDGGYPVFKGSFFVNNLYQLTPITTPNHKLHPDNEFRAPAGPTPWNIIFVDLSHIIKSWFNKIIKNPRKSLYNEFRTVEYIRQRVGGSGPVAQGPATPQDPWPVKQPDPRSRGQVKGLKPVVALHIIESRSKDLWEELKSYGTPLSLSPKLLFII